MKIFINKIISSPFLRNILSFKTIKKGINKIAWIEDFSVLNANTGIINKVNINHITLIN